MGVHLQVDRAAGEEFDEGETLLVHAVLQCLADGAAGGHDVLEAGERAAFHVHGRVELRDHFAHADRVAGLQDVASERAGLRLLAGQRGRGHLAAGHAVDRVVHEEHGHVLAAVRRLQDVVESDGRQVAVALIGDDHVVRV